jgi:hypothetical protein
MVDGNIWNDLEDVKRRSRVPSSSPEVTVQKGGSIGLNKAAIDALGRPARVRLAIRMAPPLLGIRPSDEHPDAYTVQDNARGAVINAKSAMLRLGLDLTTARRYPAEFVGGGLLVDFTVPGIPVSRVSEDTESS